MNRFAASSICALDRCVSVDATRFPSPEGTTANSLGERRSDRHARFGFTSIAILLLSGLLLTEIALSQENSASTQRITLAQIFVTRDVDQNMERIRAAIKQAKKEKAQWILFPEGALSGYYDGFDQQQVATAFSEIKQLCRDAELTGLIGTCWKENGTTYNEIRIVDADGKLAGHYAKTCLTYGDAKKFARGTFPIVHDVAGVKCGTLICNDLWVTPGFTDGPNPHLTLQQSKAGAQVIFHAVNSGSDQRYREYHEANLKVRSAEAKCPIVVVNAAREKPVNCASGVVQGFEYLVALPRVGEVIRTVEFTPREGTFD